MGDLGLHDEVMNAAEEEPALVADKQVDEDIIEDSAGFPLGQ